MRLFARRYEHSCAHLLWYFLQMLLKRRYSPSQRAVLGRMCKRIIDQGRVEFLKSIGFCGEIAQYCSEETSPENAVIVAWPSAL